jgi:hypothetical protein
MSLRKDIRIVGFANADLHQIARVTYTEDGEIFGTVDPFFTGSMEECLAYIDDMYKASLKPVIVTMEDGTYE